jgi:serine protease Do
MSAIRLLRTVSVAAMSGALLFSGPSFAQDGASGQEIPRYSAPGGAPMSFADLIEQVSPAVVSIEARGASDPRGVPDMSEIPPQFREFFERFGGMPGQGQAPERRSQGSGFFISEDGLLVTNNHVIEGSEEITVSLPGGDEFSAEVVGTDAETDIALLRVDGEGRDFAYVTLDRDPGIRVGDWVVAVGNPFGLGGTATAGIVSAIGRPLGEIQLYTDFLQIDAPINRGNSGGPTFDLNGNVVGVNSAIFSPTGGNVGIGFAIPSDLAARVIDQLMDGGEVRRGYLGIAPQSLTADLAESLGLSRGQRGVLVAEVIAGTPAAEAGLQTGDVVIRIDGRRVDDQRGLFQRIGEMPPESEITLTILRDGDERDVTVQLIERPAADTPDAPSGQAEDRLFGMILSPADEDTRERYGVTGDRGLVVNSVSSNSEAARQGIRTGDMIVEAGGGDVASVADFNAAASAARERGRNALLVLVARQQGGVRYVALGFDNED